MKTNSWAHAALVLLLLWISAPAARGYYFSPDGDDSKAGNSAVTAWKNLSKLYSVILQPGDSILLKGGDTLESAFKLDLYPANYPASSPSNPLIISSYPIGGTRAALRITAVDQHGIGMYNVQGVKISNLLLIGQGATVSTGDGISLYTDLNSGSARLRNVSIDQCEVHGFKTGIHIGAWPTDNVSFYGFDSVRVTRCIAHDNTRSGINVYGKWPDNVTNRSHRNFYVGYCKAYNNKGDPAYTDNQTGNGIVLGDVSGVLIEYCEAYNNGELNASIKGNGPVGIWLYACDKGNIQKCISHNNKTGNRMDGGGFDLDGGAEACTLQYNYSYSNAGAGYLICQFEQSPSLTKNLMRYNISQNDGSAGQLGALHFWSAGVLGISDIEIYGNTIWTEVAPAVKFGTTSGIQRVRLRNNLFITAKGKALVLGNPTTAVAKFENNAYWSSGFAFSAAGYASLAAWQSAMGQEKIGNNTTGINVDPMVTSPGAGPALTDPSMLATLQAYKLASGSPLINTGQDLSTINPGLRDFWGNSIPNGNFDIGAFEAGPVSTIRTPEKKINSLKFTPEQYDFSGRKIDLKNNVSGIRVDRKARQPHLRFME